MSYSRWSNSKWYTFHSTQPGDEAEDSENAIFEIWGVCQFTAQELRDDLQECAVMAGKIYGATIEEVADGATIEEVAELTGYMLEFLADIKRLYK